MGTYRIKEVTMKKRTGMLFAAALLLTGFSGPKSVDFKTPGDGATVKSPFRVEMAVRGMTVQPAGAVTEGAGHHHLIIDGSCIPAGQTVPKDATHKHFGKGQTETMLTLAPGAHTLTLQFANSAHASYGPEMCKTIRVKVE